MLLLREALQSVQSTPDLEGHLRATVLRKLLVGAVFSKI